MARLPTVGGDEGNWGQVLNDFLSQEHNPDGTLKKDATITGALQTANNLSDVADAGTSRANVHIPALTPAACVVTTNVATLSGLNTYDVYTLTTGDLVLLTGQVTASQNGLWLAVSGNWTRPTEMATGVIMKSRSIPIIQGTTYGGSTWLLKTNSTIKVDTDPQTWVSQLPVSVGSARSLAITAGDIPSAHTISDNTYDYVHRSDLVGSYNVKDPAYGAKGDCNGSGGGTDDTTAVQAAINAAAAAGGGVVYFPAGKYRISTQLTLTNTPHTTLRGAGRMLSQILFDDQNTGSGGLQLASSAYYSTLASDVAEDAGTFTPVSASGISVGQVAFVRGTLTRGGFWAGVVRDTTGGVITLDGKSPCVLTAAENTATTVTASNATHDILIEHLGFGVNKSGTVTTRTTPLIYGLYVYRVTINHCRFFGYQTTGAGNADAILLSNSYAITIEHNDFDTIGGSSAALNIDLYAVQDAKILHNRTRNCTCGICLSQCPNSTVHDNYLVGAFNETGGIAFTSRGIKVLAGSNRCRVTSNYVDSFNSDNNGIFVIDSARCLFAHNNIVNCGNVGINVGVGGTGAGQYIWTRYNQILGNHIHNTIKNSSNGNGIGISVGSQAAPDTSYTVIANNLIEGCDGNGIVLQNSYESCRGNTIVTFGRALSSQTGYNGAIGIYLVGGTQCSIEGNVIQNAGTGAGIYSNNTGTNYIRGNTNLGGETNHFQVSDLTSRNVPTNPVGSVAVAVPLTTVAVAATYYDRTFYVTAGATACTMAIQNGPSIVIPALGMGAIRVPAGKTVTPAYTDAPTWVVEGE